MALVTTFMTGPALDLINFIFKTNKTEVFDKIEDIKKFKILISFGNSEKGKSLLRLAHSFIRKEKSESLITAMHLTLSNELHTFDLEEQEKKIFAPLFNESKNLNQDISPVFRASSDINSDIVEMSNQGEHDLLLVDLGQSIFEGTLLGKVLGFTTKMITPDRLIDTFIGKENLFENSPFDEKTRQIISKK